MSALFTVASLVAQASAEPDSLVATLGGWVLVGPPPAEEAGEWTFRTVSARAVRDASGAVEAILDEGYLVYPLRKLQPGPFASTILIGRSRTNDVCVSHSSVSKLHARVRVANDGLFLSDAGSSNGTALQDLLLVPGKEQPITHGMMVRFGVCSFQLFEPTRFVRILARFSTSR